MNWRFYIRVSGASLWLILPALANANVRLPRLFSDGMVLQRDRPVLVWGSAEPGEAVSVGISSVEAPTHPAQSKGVKADATGYWSATLDPLQVGAPLILTVNGKDNAVRVSDILVGDVYQVSGQSNAAMSLNSCARMPGVQEDIAKTALPQVRIFEVPWGLFKDAPQPDVPETCSWKPLKPETNPGFSALAFYFARNLHQHLGIPIGIVRASHAGGRAEIKMPMQALMSYEGGRQFYASALDAYQMARTKKQAQQAQSNTPDGLPPEPQSGGTVNGRYPSSDWNGAIAPVIRFAKRGIVWYQGEHNAGDGEKYTETLSVLLRSWREACGDPNRPFLLVQLPRFQAKGWPSLRESQLAAYRRMPNCGFVVTIDLGEKENIHPADKRPLGERLALEARHLIYHEAVSGCGPLYKNFAVEGEKVVVHFTHTGGGLKIADGKSLAGFLISDASRSFVPAQAEIVGDTVVLHCAGISMPTAVRYLWESFPESVNLCNTEGLPASPFRTDHWADRP